MFRKRDESTVAERDKRVVDDGDPVRPYGRDRARGLIRGVATLLGAAGAGLLVWLATQVNDSTTGGYWAVYGLLAAAGLALALSQLLGGWTKWGWPRVSMSVFLIGFLPALVAGGWLLLGHQPNGNWFRTHVLNWSNDAGVGGVVEDLREYLAVVAFGLGILFGFTFDTTGPRVRDAAVAEPGRREVEPVPVEDRDAADEPVAAERSAVAPTTDEPAAAERSAVAPTADEPVAAERSAVAPTTDEPAEVDEPDGGRRLFGRRRRVEPDRDTTVTERPPANGTDD